MRINIKRLTLTALLIAIAILIPIVFAPLRITIGPMSWTPAAHVPIFIACFISPPVAIAVAIGATIGFFFTAPLVITARAATHVIFAGLLAFYVKNKPNLSTLHMIIVSIVVGIIHALCEALVVWWLFFGSIKGNPAYYIWALVGIGTLVHSIVDFWIAMFIVKVLKRAKRV